MTGPSSSSSSSATGIGFFGLLTIVFVVAKLFGVINWSWWLVFSPIIVGFVIALVLIIGFIILVAKLDK